MYVSYNTPIQSPTFICLHNEFGNTYTRELKRNNGVFIIPLFPVKDFHYSIIPVKKTHYSRVIPLTVVIPKRISLFRKNKARYSIIPGKKIRYSYFITPLQPPNIQFYFWVIKLTEDHRDCFNFFLKLHDEFSYPNGMPVRKYCSKSRPFVRASLF